MANECTKWLSDRGLGEKLRRVAKADAGDDDAACDGDCEPSDGGSGGKRTQEVVSGESLSPREARMKMDPARVSSEKVTTTRAATRAPATTCANASSKRPTLRKQGSGSHRLDSCASSDSGQGTNSSGSLAACSSLVSVAGCAEAAACAHELPPNSSASASASPSSSSSSSSSCNSSSSASSSSFASSSCASSSSSPPQLDQQQLVPRDQVGQTAGLGRADSDDAVEAAACSSGARRRQSWLMSFGGDPNAARILASCQQVAGSDHQPGSATVAQLRQQSNTLESVQADANVCCAESGQKSANQGAATNDCEQAFAEVCEKVAMHNGPQNSATNQPPPPPRAQAQNQGERKQAAKSSKKSRAQARDRDQELGGARKSLVIGGRVKRVHFFPTSPSVAKPEASRQCGCGFGAEHLEPASSTVGHLVVCLDVNERERRQLMKSSLIRRKLGLDALPGGRSPPSSSSQSPSASASSDSDESAAAADNSFAAKQLPASHFWRLVASESSGDDDEDGELDLPHAQSPQTDTTCPLVRLIQVADQDLNNRPRLLLLEQSELRLNSDPIQNPNPNQNQERGCSSASPLRSVGEQLGGQVPRLNSIDEEEVCLTTQLNSSAELEFSYSSTSPADSTSTATTDEDGEGVESATSLLASSLHCLDLSEDERRGSNGPLMQPPEAYARLGSGLCEDEEASRISGSARNESKSCARAATSQLDRFVAAEAGRKDGSAASWLRPNELERGLEGSAAGLARQSDNGQNKSAGRTKVRQEEIREETAAAPAEQEMNAPAKAEDDDDYFYDDELAFASGLPSGPGSAATLARLASGPAPRSEPHPLAGSRPKSKSSAAAVQHQSRQRRDSGPILGNAAAACNGESASMSPASPTLVQPLQSRSSRLAASRALVSTRPLLVWAPSVRRTSCPVGGQLNSFSSWRQLWPPALEGATNGLQVGCSFVCNQCLRTVPQANQQQPTCQDASSGQDPQALVRLIQMQQHQRPASPSSFVEGNLQQRERERERKASQHSLFSVRTSDYFSSFDQPDPPTYNAAGSWLSVQQEDPSPVAPAPGAQRSRLAFNQQRALVPSANLRSGSNRTEPASNELRRQSTITGFDHYKYQAPRSPSLCLPGARPGRLQRQSTNNSARPYLLSAHQTQQRLSPTHSTGGSSSPSPTHWHQQQAALLLAAQQANYATNQQMHSQPPSNQSQRGSLRGFARARLESLESDRGSSPSWSASTTSLRSTGSIYSIQRKLSQAAGCSAPATCAPGNWCQQCNPIVRSDKFRPKLPLAPAATLKQQHAGALSLASMDDFQPLHFQPNPSQQVIVPAQQQQQAVYFFLCCCQRRNSPSADPREQQQQGEAEEQENNEDQRQDANANQEQRRRVSLVARPAIVGAYDSSGNLRQYQRGQGPRAQEAAPVGQESAPLMSNVAADRSRSRSQVGAEPGEAGQVSARDGQAAAAGQGEGAGEEMPKEQHEESTCIGEQLRSLLDRLDEIQRQAASQRPLLSGTATGGEQRVAERQLMEAIKQRVAETERILTMGFAASALPASPRGADLMRYSTPNLLVSSNFEHIMRLREKRAKEEAAEEQASDGREPPEATEAWFLSRSPAGGANAGASQASRCGSAASGRAFVTQRQLSRESIRSARNVTDARNAACIIDDEQQERARRRFSVQPTSGEDAASARGGARSPPTNANVSSRVDFKQTTSDLDPAQAQSQRPTVTDERVVPAPKPQTTEAQKPGQQPSAGGLYCPSALSQVSGFVHDKSMAQARYLYSTLTSNTTALLCASSAAAPPSSTATAPASAAPTSTASSATAATSSAATAASNNKGLSGNGQVKSGLAAGQSPSPTRVHGIQRKQAQFVADRHSQQSQQQQHRLLASGVAQSQQRAASQATIAPAVAMQAKEVESPRRVALGEVRDERQAPRLQSEVDQAELRAGSGGAKVDQHITRAQVSSSQPDGGDSDNDSDSGSSRKSSSPESSSTQGSGDDDVEFGDEQRWRRHQHRMDRGPTKEDGAISNDDDEGADANEDANKMPRHDKTASRQETPSIVESQYDVARRQSQGSRQTSRSNSVVTGSDTPMLVSQHSTGQLQPSAMDPAMHALWAQGADLDTGNGNFIMATRRRRSVHALHQVHQIQQQQQLQGKQQFQPSRSFAAGASSSSGAGSTGEQVGGSYKCYKIDERHGRRRAPPSGSHEGWVSDEQYPASRASGSSTPSSGVQHPRSLKSELKKLRATSSIDETARGGSLHRARFVSAPSPAQGISPSNTVATLVHGEVSDETEEIHLEDEEASIREEAGQDFSAVSRKDTQIEVQTTVEDGENVADSKAQQQQLERMFYLEDAEYDLDELESSSSMLANLYDWNYPIFELSERYGNSILSKLSYRIFFDSGFFDSFKIPKQAFFNFFHALEDGYHHKPYHNRLHAADVLHAVYYLTSQPIDNFCQVPLDLIEHYDDLLTSTRQVNFIDKMQAINNCTNQQQPIELGEDFVSKLHNHIVAVVVAAAAAADDSELPFGIMGANLTALEVMALYTAAAMHDFQHPGRTNSFLVATSSPLALLYNDRSVLESHHSAAAWALFYSGPGFNWLCNLEKDEFKRFRFMIIELILATDLMRHYELVSAFNKKLNNVGRHNIDWFCESDRLLVMEIIIKLADVNGPMKGHQLHCQWTDRIAMEFYEQGDEERALNLPVSLYMDRSDPRLPELQKSFINHLVGPLSHSYAAAGFFPRSTDPAIIESEERDQTEAASAEIESEEKSVYNQSKYWLIEDTNGSELNKQFLRCTQTLNLRNNFLYWDAKSKEKQVTSTTNEPNQTNDREE